MNNKLYVIAFNGMEWEDIVIYDILEEGYEELKKIERDYPKLYKEYGYRIEVFQKKDNKKFTPTYQYEK